MHASRLVAAGVVLALFVAACGDDDASSANGGDGGDDLAAEVVTTYADGVHASYEASLEAATTMDEAVDAFIDDPTEHNLEAAKQAWLDARDDYGVTEVYRFYGGPIDNEEDGPEGLINAWPLDEVYIDYVEGDAEAGIVNDAATYPTVDAELISSLNEQGGEANIATGWHAIEFLLWGQDLSEDGAGERPVTDYTDAPNADRRATYLAVASDLLLEHLQSLVDAWAPDEENYRAEFLALPTDEALTHIITGIGEMSRGELAGERMSVAYLERSQEDEHSCFSDNTTTDIVANASGIRNVVLGTYPGDVSGPGVAALVETEDAELAAQLIDEVEGSVDLAGEIPAPFDQHLGDGVPDDSPGRTAILTTIESLEDQTDTIVAGADALGLTINVT